MEIDSFDVVKEGLILYLLGSDKPIIESLNLNLTDQQQTLNNQFKGMTDIPFSYEEFERTISQRSLSPPEPTLFD